MAEGIADKFSYLIKK